jgi:Na+/phosphate symporter
MTAPIKLMKDLGFSDLGRLLQQTTSENTAPGSPSDAFNIAVACLFLGLPMLVVAIFACIRLKEMREHSLAVPELPSDAHKTPKSTLAGRKRAIVELFETSDVTMVSQDQAVIAKGSRISNSRER